jgi:phospholipid transport system substrate-binding protein
MESLVCHNTRSRRPARLQLLLSLALVALSTPIAATADDRAPEAVVSEFDASLLQVMRDATQHSFRMRFDALATSMDTTFDFEGMAAMALGSAWHGITLQERTAVVNAFRRFSVASYVGAFDSYSDQRYVIVGRSSVPQGVIVMADLVQADNQGVRFGYLLHQVGGTWRVIDIYLDGTISQLALRRSEFYSVLAQAGTDGLVNRLVQKAKSFEGPEKAMAQTLPGQK